MKKWLITGLAAVAATAAMAQGPWAGRGAQAPGQTPDRRNLAELRERGVDMFFGAMENPEARRALGVSEEQVEKLQKLRRDSEERMGDLRAAAEKTQAALREAVESDQVDADDLEETVDRALKAEGALKKATIMTQAKAKAILGPEAARKIRARVAERVQQFRGGQARAPQGGPQGESHGPWQPEQLRMAPPMAQGQGPGPWAFRGGPGMGWGRPGMGQPMGAPQAQRGPGPGPQAQRGMTPEGGDRPWLRQPMPGPEARRDMAPQGETRPWLRQPMGGPEAPRGRGPALEARRGFAPQGDRPEGLRNRPDLEPDADRENAERPRDRERRGD